MKHTNKALLGKGLKYFAGAIPLSGIGPIVLYSAFNNQNHPWYLAVLIFGILACAAAVFFMFKGITTLVRSLFD
ncbi:hypothetical protein FK178_00850 [Antarcticibacterium arcticum]|uniref:Uncharacterized protein n=1 Tax=Antarcticibacterium arcticum TaxID=2585771 RepID=A0A5B8YEN3_9FLAO|nr:DUF6095 family protein [Antarcticibacterium arcticum]QED36355.1 hypothetical protein FK178_00850 [Antarcticibacterium arcticum]